MMAVKKNGSKSSPKSKFSSRRNSYTPRSAVSSAPAYALTCKRHNPCELCVDICPPNSRIGCRCNTSATARTCRCPQKLGKKFICDSYKVRVWTEQLKARAMHGQPGLLGENKPISRRDQFSSTYSLAFIDPDSRDYNNRNVDRPAGVATMKVPAPPEKKRPQRGCCVCSSWDDGRSNATVRSHGSHSDECAYCGFKEGAFDFRPKIRRSQKQQRRSLTTMTSRTIRDAETSTDTTKSGFRDKGARTSDEVLTKLDSMEEDLNYLNKQLMTTGIGGGKEGRANESTPKAQRKSKNLSLAAEVMQKVADAKEKELEKNRALYEEKAKYLEEHLLVKKERAFDPGYAQYTQYAY